jgi:hypothetical protein
MSDGSRVRSRMSRLAFRLTVGQRRTRHSRSNRPAQNQEDSVSGVADFASPRAGPRLLSSPRA